MLTCGYCCAECSSAWMVCRASFSAELGAPAVHRCFKCFKSLCWLQAKQACLVCMHLLVSACHRPQAGWDYLIAPATIRPRHAPRLQQQVAYQAPSTLACTSPQQLAQVGITWEVFPERWRCKFMAPANCRGEEEAMKHPSQQSAREACRPGFIVW